MYLYIYINVSKYLCKAKWTTGIYIEKLTATRCNMLHCNTLERSANTPQHSATQGNTHCNTDADKGANCQTANGTTGLLNLENLTTTHTATYRNATHCIAPQHIATHTATHRNTLQLIETHCNTSKHTATHRNTLQLIETHCNSSKHTAAHCNTSKHTAAHCNTSKHTVAHCSTLQYAATHWNTPQHNAAHCNTQCNNHHDTHRNTHHNTLQHTTTHHNT